jgi:hypothetical protein
MPMFSAGIQPTPEQAAQMQRLALRAQHQQLTLQKQMLVQYGQSIDTALKQIQEAIDKADSSEGERSDETTAPAAHGQIFAQSQALNQVQQTQARALAARYDPRRMDFRQDWQLQDCQAWNQGGMGDFGRPIF